MTNFKPSKLFLILTLLAISFVHTIIHDQFIDSRVTDAQRSLHTQVIDGKAPAPIQYRIMVYYLAEMLIKAGFSFEVAYQLIRLIFLFLSGYFFYLFLLNWFVPTISLLGVLYFFAVLPITYLRYYMQPMDTPNLFFFLAGYTIILKRKDWLLVPLIFISMLNRETPILLIPVYLFYRWDELKLRDLFIRTSLVSVVGFGTYLGLRKIFALKEYYSDLFYLTYNITNYRTYLFMFCLFGPFIIFAFKNWSEKPKFLKRAALMLPFFLIIHFTMTIMTEPRLWLPVVPLIIALGLFGALPKDCKIHIPPTETSKKSHGKILYLIILGGFILFFAGFFHWYQSVHLKNRYLFNKIQRMLQESKIYISAGRLQEAVEELNKVIVLDPKNDEAHYQLGLIYAYYLHDDKKALDNFQKCIELNPYHADARRIKNQIDWLMYKKSKTPG